MTDDDRAAMVADLQQLRRGHGLHPRDVMERAGARLREACGVGPELSAGEGRQRLIDVIGRTVRELPEDLRLPLLAAFALPPASQQRFLRERMAWVGEQIHRDPRTAIRRVEAGLTLLAEALLDPGEEQAPEPSEYAPDGWYVNVLRATLLLNVERVQLLEARQITSTVAGLAELVVSWSVPAGAGEGAEVAVEMLYGGELERDEAMSTPSYWAGRLRLPRPLERGEQWEYQVRVASVPMAEFPPYYVLTPYRRCDRFELRAKFARDRRPARVWQLDAVPFQLVHEARPVGRTLEPDGVGEVTTRFASLRPGMSYGLRWLDRPSA